MKNIIKNIAVSFATGVLLLCSCNSLDQAPTNRFTDDGFWTKPERAQMVLNMAYSQMYAHDKIWVDEALSDNLYEQRKNPDTRIIRTGQATPSTGIFTNEWKAIFEGIKTSNVFMAKVDLVPGMDVKLKDKMKAEIRFIRASLYFRLVNFYGDAPFFLNDISLEQSRVMTRTPKATIISELHRELEEIIPILPSKAQISADQNGAISKAAAMVLNARIYLYAGNMEKVAEICGKLINEPETYGKYSLFKKATDNYSAYENLFTSAHEYNEEVILDYSAMELIKEWATLYEAVPITAGASLCQRAPTRELVDSYVMSNGLKITDAASGYKASTPYVGRDPRMTATVVYNGFLWKDKTSDKKYTEWKIDIVNNSSDKFGSSNGTPTGYYIRKYFDPDHGKELKMWTNIIMMRYADVLLMYAEAKQALGEFSLDTWDQTIRPIRERAGFDETGCKFPSSVTGNDMRDLIRNERRAELALEGLRYFDLLRWDLARTLLSGPVQSAQEFNKIIDSRSYSDRDKLWSLPQSELDLIPTLRPNNSGY